MTISRQYTCHCLLAAMPLSNWVLLFRWNSVLYTASSFSREIWDSGGAGENIVREIEYVWGDTFVSGLSDDHIGFLGRFNGDVRLY